MSGSQENIIVGGSNLYEPGLSARKSIKASRQSITVGKNFSPVKSKKSLAQFGGRSYANLEDDE